MTQEPVAARPSRITVTAWLWIGWAVFLILGGIGAIMIAVRGVSRDPDRFGRAMCLVLGHSGLLGALQLCLGIFAIISAVHLLKLRTWARKALQIVSAVWLILIVGFCIVCFTGLLQASGAAGGSRAAVGTLVLLIVALIYAAPAVVALALLRSRALKSRARKKKYGW